MTVHEFNPELLRLARQSRSMSQRQLSQLSGVSNGAISRYEAGALEISEDRLSDIAAVLDYPASFFCRKPILVGNVGGALFHRKQQRLSTKILYKAHALAEVRRLEISAMLQSMDIQDAAVPEYPVDLFDDDPDKIARSVRAAMNIPPGPIFNLTETLERSGCVVVPHDFGSRQIDGFSQRPLYPPCFLHLNADLPPDRWRWTLAHELGHMVMHFDPMASRKEVEDQANVFAAEFLAPAHEIGPMLDGLTFQKLSGLKREWKISMQAIMVHAHRLGCISSEQYRSMYVRLSKAGYRTREPEILDPPAEVPGRMKYLAQAHMDQLEYSRCQLRALLTIGETDFRKHYLASDILESLGIDRLLT